MLNTFECPNIVHAITIKRLLPRLFSLFQTSDIRLPVVGD